LGKGYVSSRARNEREAQDSALHQF